ncbi:mechanosensitive ion channel family protein [Erythrobacter sp. YT30]|uniref:mechanosensitive ion channel family protein n=1 Tax=Erythrobacter sp. YT30 TaxID=1735012 RepID=UPI00076C0F76|nr:mechanosensitive ion channel [Erythrobacter sp. YT30]KWV92717.1 mechanosensitive ion channel protein MscS [Erythrobacter sp. YT30]
MTQQNSSFEPIAILTNQLSEMGRGVIAMLPNIAIAVVLLGITWAVARFASQISEKITKGADMRQSLRELIELAVKFSIWAVGLLISGTVLLPNLTLSSIIAGLGVGTVAIGFAFKDVFENFMAGILFMLREKMRIGDYIGCDGIEGRVEQISLRETHLRKTSNELAVVPNSVLFKNPIEILTDKDKRRFELIIGVSYDTDLARASDIISKAVEGSDAIDQEKPIDVFATEFNSSSVDFRVRWWSGSEKRDEHVSRDAMIRTIKSALDREGIEIPYPYQTHTFKEPMKLASND